ncbi:ABC transporter ATP-binding protein [Tropicibacter sp. Alg240-R139]|uniref:ABC transporter ATP-binding protein n=1 Tax=Tropicibacter sp. Alg240-R139 TaxID=2305991 RepID=UPI0013DEA5A3|nr:ABC transporter ATP-binding protein [Tropicibacter sp. Alg240-R139]
MASENTAPCAIAVRDVRFDWPGGQFGLDVPTFDVLQNESVLLLGQSGSGKSTLLSLICGILAPSQGVIQVAGTDIGALGRASRDRFRADHIGIIFQMFNLLPYATALDNILVPLRFSKARRARMQSPRQEALALTKALGLPETLVTGVQASTLSVGQQQRVAVARAMIGNPKVVIADEPTSALDSDAQGEFLELVFRQVQDAEAALLMVSHDERLADRFDRVIRLDQIASLRRAGGA